MVVFLTVVPLTELIKRLGCNIMDNINQIVILDNGAHTIKVGFYTENCPKLIPNCITKVKNEKRRPFIGDQMEECKDYSGMFYILPFNRGYLLNWDVQRQIWDYIFRTILKLQSDNKNRFSNVGLLITEPVYNFPQIRKLMIKILFEEYGFGKILISSAPQLAAFNYKQEDMTSKEQTKSTTKSDLACCLVVESGYSFSHVVPFVDGHKILAHTKRIDVGGKALTNHLKEIISYRQINVLDETYVVNQMKEDCCYVSVDFWKDHDIAARKHKENHIVRDYILPDYIVYKRGFVYEKEKHIDLNTADYQLIRMNNERFQVPEILFHPSDVNLDQIGISETIIYSLNEFHPDFQMISNANDFSVPVHTSRERPENLKDIESEEEEEEESNSLKPSDSKVSKLNDCNGFQNKTSDNIDDGLIDLSIYDDENIKANLYGNILLIGGNCRFANFKDRIYQDLRSYVADILDVKIKLPENPITYAWQGGRILCTHNSMGEKLSDHKNSLFHRYAVSRKEYIEHGLNYCHKKLSNYRLIIC